jgi:SAM-dependent methyltransferase
LQASPGGEVVGLDQDPSHIDEAERRSCQLQTADVVSYHCCDATGPLPEVLRDRLFDVIVLFNCICYFSNPAEVLARYWQRLRPGGRLLVRDSDMGHFLVSPFDDSLQSRVIAAAKKGGGATFDNFFGRNLFGLVSAIPSARTQVQVWPYPMSGSLTEPEKRYASTNLLFLLDQAGNELSQHDRELWTARYDRSNPDALIHKPDFLFLMHEIVVTGHN